MWWSIALWTRLSSWRSTPGIAWDARGRPATNMLIQCDQHGPKMASVSWRDGEVCTDHVVAAGVRGRPLAPQAPTTSRCTVVPRVVDDEHPPRIADDHELGHGRRVRAAEPRADVPRLGPWCVGDAITPCPQGERRRERKVFLLCATSRTSTVNMQLEAPSK